MLKILNQSRFYIHRFRLLETNPELFILIVVSFIGVIVSFLVLAPLCIKLVEKMRKPAIFDEETNDEVDELEELIKSNKPITLNPVSQPKKKEYTRPAHYYEVVDTDQNVNNQNSDDVSYNQFNNNLKNDNQENFDNYNCEIEEDEYDKLMKQYDNNFDNID